MPYTDAQKRARNKYEQAHYTVIGCKVRKEYADAFRAACAALETTPAAVFKAAADSILQRYESERGTTAPAPIIDNASANE